MKFTEILKLGNKGQLGNLTSVGYGLMILGIVLGLSLVVLANFKATPAVYNNSAAANTTIGSVMSVYDSLVGWLPIIIIVIVVAIILGLLGFAFGGRQPQ